jgi:hypothetical protein
MQLNLRDLFWLIFVAAVATMWWMDRSKLADRLSFYETPQSELIPPPMPILAPALPQPYVESTDPFGAPAVPDNGDPFAPPPKAVDR